MIFFTILITLASQIVLYQLGKKVQFRFKNIFILVFCLVLHLFILPQYFVPTPDPNGTCAMPAMIILFAFWILGGLGSIILHIIYYFISKYDN